MKAAHAQPLRIPAATPKPLAAHPFNVSQQVLQQDVGPLNSLSQISMQLKQSSELWHTSNKGNLLDLNRTSLSL